MRRDGTYSPPPSRNPETMTDQEESRIDIDTLRALIQRDLDKLDSRALSADERRLIKDHLDTLISDLQTLLKHLG